MAIGEQITDGYKETEIARQLGRTPSWVSERLNELRTEILLQNELLPPLTDHEYQSLKQSIATYGQWHPILVNRDLKLIDGAHRLRACHELDRPAKYLILDGLTPNEEWELAVALNASRRQMTRQQKRKLIEHELMRNPNRSDRRIAAMCGVHHETVAAARTEIADAGDTWVAQGLPAAAKPAYAGEPDDPDDDQIPQVAATATIVLPATPPPAVAPAARVDARGRRQPAKKPPRPPIERVIQTIACPCCGHDLELVRAGAVYTIRPHPAAA